MKLEKDTIEKMKGFQDSETQILLDIGNLNVQYHDLNNQLQARLVESVKERQEFYQKFEERYGKGQIDLAKGEFIPEEEQQKEK
jgi:hypothetical protein